jgi:3',5'-cyclic AMP phosphodiesterase CpdA
MGLRLAMLLACALAVGACGDDDPRVPADPPGATIVWAVGDGGSNSDAARRVAALIAHDDPDHVIYLGDVYENGTRAEFETNFAEVYGNLVKRMWPTPGNHEWANRRTGYDAYWRRRTGRAPAPWYARRLGGWEILVLNSEAPHGPGSPQLTWLRRQVAAAPGDCRIAAWHRPRFSAGLHGDQEDMAPLWDALQGHGRLVLGGHDHDLQRFKPVGGLVQMVSGAGGRHLYDVGGHDALVFADDEHFGAVRLELSRGRARWTFITDRGRVLDRGVLRCRPGG